MRKFTPLFTTNLSFVVALLILLSMSCQREVAPLQSVQVIDPGLSVVEGRLVFKSLDDLERTINSLKGMTESQRQGWSKKMEYKSLKDFYVENEGMTLGSVNPIYKTRQGDAPFISDELFARVLNRDGVYQLGEQVHRITLEGKELTTNQNNVTQLMLGGNGKNVETHSIVNEAKGLPGIVTQENARVMAPDIPVYSYSIDDTHAVFGVFSKFSSVFYQSYTFKLQAREYRGWWIFAGWQPYTASRLTIADAGYTGIALLSGNIYGGAGSDDKSDTDEASAFLDPGLYGPIILTIQAVHAQGSFKYDANWPTINYNF